MRAAVGGQVVGEAREFHERHDMEGSFQWTIWDFRVDRYDASGNRLTPVPVEMRAEKFHNVITDGDWVEVPGTCQPGEMMRPTLVHNLTTGADVLAEITPLTRRGLKMGKYLPWIVLSIIVAMGVLWFLCAILGSMSGSG